MKRVEGVRWAGKGTSHCAEDPWPISFCLFIPVTAGGGGTEATVSSLDLE